jgi:hypothetical protein
VPQGRRAFEFVQGAIWALSGAGAGHDPNPSESARAINAAFDRVLSEEHWIAAGLPCDSSNFSSFKLDDGDEHCLLSQRRFTTTGNPLGALLTLEIEERARAEIHRLALLERLHRDEMKLAEGHPPGGNDPARSWYVFAGEWIAKRNGYPHLTGLCFYDGVRVQVRFERLATEGQAAGFRAVIEDSAARLASACTTELKPYVERMEAKANRH